MAKATLTHDGRTMGYKEWAQETGISEVTIRRRVSMGWTPEQVLTTGTERKSWAETLTFDGITDTYAGWAQRIGISECQLRRRLSKKAHVHEENVWTLEEALTTPPKDNPWNDKNVGNKYCKGRNKKYTTAEEDATELERIFSSKSD